MQHVTGSFLLPSFLAFLYCHRPRRRTVPRSSTTPPPLLNLLVLPQVAALHCTSQLYDTAPAAPHVSARRDKLRSTKHRAHAKILSATNNAVTGQGKGEGQGQGRSDTDSSQPPPQQQQQQGKEEEEDGPSTAEQGTEDCARRSAPHAGPAWSCGGVVSLPLPWLCVLWQRALQHPNLNMQRLGLRTFLQRHWNQAGAQKWVVHNVCSIRGCSTPTSTCNAWGCAPFCKGAGTKQVCRNRARVVQYVCLFILQFMF